MTACAQIIQFWRVWLTSWHGVGGRIRTMRPLSSQRLPEARSACGGRGARERPMPEAPGAAALATGAGGPGRCRGGGRLGRARPDGRRSIWRAALPVSATPSAPGGVWPSTWSWRWPPC